MNIKPIMENEVHTLLSTFLVYIYRQIRSLNSPDLHAHTVKGITEDIYH